ncbi:MAG TPA: GMC oxidoreductase [Mycobacterium sp.]|nr:GMC oxidoreductase [Mycobacterium sp.]
MRICDGSVFPGPVGANPSMTIAAFARRAARQLIEHGDPADWPPVVQP